LPSCGWGECTARSSSTTEFTMHATALRSSKSQVLDADPAIGRFLDAVWMERGLSPNTLAAYRADRTALARWLEERHVALTSTTRADLLQLPHDSPRASTDAAPSSMSRASVWRAVL
jgi:site-specific recombinase XerD